MDTLEKKLNNEGLTAQELSDIRPLLANKTFQESSQHRAATAKATADAQAQTKAQSAECSTEVNLFLTAARSLREIGAKFPDVAFEVAAAKAALETAMSKVK